MMQFHEKLFNLRKQAHMTQEELAEKLNVSRQAVSRWEMGTAKPEVDTLIAISDLFGVTLDFLLKDGSTGSEERHQTEVQLPPFRKFLPKRWWLPGAGSLLCKVLEYGILIVIYLLPQAYRRHFQNAIQFWPEIISPLLHKLTSLFLVWFVLVLGWTLLKWWKSKQ